MASKRRNFVVRGIAAIAVMAGSVSFGARADAAYSDCPINRYCIWLASNYFGTHYDYASPSYPNAVTGSIANRTGYEVRCFRSNNTLVVTLQTGTGYSFSVKPTISYCSMTGYL
jgi:hypothetical protein